MKAKKTPPLLNPSKQCDLNNLGIKKCQYYYSSLVNQPGIRRRGEKWRGQRCDSRKGRRGVSYVWIKEYFIKLVVTVADFNVENECFRTNCKHAETSGHAVFRTFEFLSPLA